MFVCACTHTQRVSMFKYAAMHMEVLLCAAALLQAFTIRQSLTEREREPPDAGRGVAMGQTYIVDVCVLWCIAHVFDWSITVSFVVLCVCMRPVDPITI